MHVLTHRLNSKLLSRTAAVATLAGGIVSLAAWITASPRLADWWNTGITIKANTAIALIAAGSSLLIATYRRSSFRLGELLASALAVVCFLLGALTLLEHITDIDLKIDTLFFDEPTGARATSAPGRMGPPASFSFTLQGIALVQLHCRVRARSIAAGLALFTLSLAGLSLIGFCYGAELMYTVPRLTGISPQTALLIAVLSIGILATMADRQPMKTLLADSNAGILARRLIPIAFAVPLGLGWLRLLGSHRGLFDNTFGTALRSLLEIVVLSAVLWWSVQAIRAREIKQRRAEAERRASERNLRQTLIDADRRKDEFLATLAHELRNPLAPIRNATSVLLMRSDGDESLRWSAEIIDRQLRHMVRLLEDLLDISRVSRNRLELRIATVDLRRIVETAAETSRPAIESAGHRLDIILPSQPVEFEGDEVRLIQVFSNLLNNAANYTPRGGRIDVVAAMVAGEVIVRVIDNGVGIESGEFARIFDVFTQAKPGSPHAQKGLGIGLALARGIVELHGGTIEVRSAGSGFGSEFIVRLPGAKTAVVAANKTTAAMAPATSLRIVVVDDMRDSADTLAALLTALGHRVQVAYNGETAIDLVETTRPDAVFLDIGMPGLDGIDVCRHIRACAFGNAISVIALTGWGQEQDRRRTSDAGFDAHLVKPVDMNEVLRLLDDLKKPRA